MRGSAGLGAGCPWWRADRRARIRRFASALVAAAAVSAGTLIATHHPLWPATVTLLFLGIALLLAWRSEHWLLLVPAGLPLLSWAPESGWTAVDEFDLLVFAAVAGSHARLALRPYPTSDGEDRASRVLVLALTLFVGVSVVALLRGLAEAGGLRFDSTTSYVDSMNVLRVFKPLLLSLLLVPSLAAEMGRDPERTTRFVGLGMCLGLGVVTLAVLWERVAYPGLTDFSKPYRAVALFWEMHVGGAAIDAYLAMATPFAIWALRSARTPLPWSGAALLALLTGYACLTTFSRGVYVAVACPLLMLATLARPDLFGWRRVASLALVVALIAEIGAVIWTGSFLLERMARSEYDLGGRIAHWQRAIGLVRDPFDRLFGIGLGRAPAELTRAVRGYEFPGTVRLEQDGVGPRHAVLTGPATRSQLEGLYSMTQRVALNEGALYRVDFDHRASITVGLWLGVCELHLLYERECQNAWIEILPADGAWQHRSVLLKGPGLAIGHRFAPRRAVFEFALLGAGTTAEFRNLELHASDSPNLLRNGNFAEGMARWLPSAQSYFVPWHLDSLYVELLVERGAIGLGSFVLVVGVALRRLLGGGRRHSELAPILAASLGGALLVGLVSSIADQSRTAFLFCFLFALALILGERPPQAQSAAVGAARPGD